MLTQVLARLSAIAPPLVVNVHPVISVVNDGDADPVPRIPSYLKVMDNMQKLDTKYFSGGAKPIEADEWRNRL